MPGTFINMKKPQMLDRKKQVYLVGSLSYTIGVILSMAAAIVWLEELPYWTVVALLMLGFIVGSVNYRGFRPYADGLNRAASCDR